MMMILRPSTDRDLPRIIDIWRRAVDATHDFLTPDDRKAIEAEVLQFFPQLSFQVAVDGDDTPQGFMFLHDGHLEALFVDPDRHGQGIGAALIGSALAAHPGLTTDVNAQNGQALGFYTRVGFAETGRSPVDGQGRPYPLIHMQYQAGA